MGSPSGTAASPAEAEQKGEFSGDAASGPGSVASGRMSGAASVITF